MAQHPFGGDPDQPVGDLADAFLQPRLLCLPGAAAKPVQQALFMTVPAKKFDVLNGKIQPVSPGIFQRHAFMRRPQRLDHFQPVVAADAVVDMHDQVARRQRLRLGQEILGTAFFRSATDQAVAKDVLLGDHRKARHLEPCLQRPDRQAGAFAVADVGKPVHVPRARNIVILQQVLQPLGRTVRIGCQHHRPRLRARPHMIRNGAKEADLFLLPLGREIAPDAPARVDHPRPRRLRQRDELQHPPRPQRGLPPGVVEIKQPRRRGLVDRIEPRLLVQRVPPCLVLVDDAVPTGQPDRCRLVVKTDRGTRHVIEQRLQPFMKEGQPMFDPGMLSASADRLVKRIVGARRAEFDTIILPKPGDRRLVEDDLGHGR